jgi:hypothetical protein
MPASPYPSLTLDEWRGTRDAIHGYSRVLGKIRQALAPPRKHWFHITLHAAAAGLRTPPMVKDGVAYELCLDLANHQLTAASSAGFASKQAVEGQPVARFRDGALGMLAELGCDVEIDTSLLEDDEPLTYEASHAHRFWQAFTRINGVFELFRGSLREETGPVHLWPHHFDLAVLWFSGRLVPGVDPADEESADEQMNFGFSTGDESIDEPYFYITAYPAPSGLHDTPLPDGATWHSEGFVGALLSYAALVDADDGDGLLLEFLSTVQAAGAKAMGVGR